MPEIKNNFLKGKMNKDLDERIIPKGEYREAQNVAISESEDSDVGAIEIIRGNEKVSGTVTMSGTPEVIGYVRDIQNKRIYYFVTNFTGNDTENIRKILRAQGAGSNHTTGGSTYSSSSTDNCKIVMYDIVSGATTEILSGSWLNFSKNHLITGAQVIDDLLFFTDDYNQPRKINIKKCLDSGTSNYYQFEDQISVAKYAPYLPIRLVNRNGFWSANNTASSDTAADKTDATITSEYMKERFIRFSYRYKYEDGEYSLIAPFTQIVFEPLHEGLINDTEDANNSANNTQPNVITDKHTIFRTGKVNIMQNAINTVPLRIPIPNINERDDSADYSGNTYSNDYKIDSIEVLVKESDGLAIKIIKTINISELQQADFDFYQEKFSSSGDTYDRQVVKYIYKSEKPFQVLPGDQITRVYDQVPVRAKALDIVGNRLVFGNYIENYEYPLDNSGKKGINYTVGETVKGDINHTTTHGHKRHEEFSYKYHSIKQRRTYQVGIVFADKYGRQSPVILSSSGEDNSDTVTVAEQTASKLLFDSNSDSTPDTWSWSSQQVAYGLGLKINFQSTSLFDSSTKIYDAEFNAGYNPHGWYSYRVVVKQTEQEYHNIYCSHPFQNWDNIENEPVPGTANFRGKSWLSLIGDNINKIPRNINDSDVNRPGVAGSDVDLYPKIVYKQGDTTGRSEQNDQFHELLDVISLGNAFEQSLFVSGDDNGESGTGGFNVYDFVYAKDKNPLIAELPNVKKYYDTGSDINGDCFVAFVNADSGTHNSGTAAASKIVQVHNTNETTGSGNASSDPFGGDDVVNGFIVNASAIKNKNKPVKVVDYVQSTRLVTLDTKQEFKEGDYLIFSRYREGLSVFETEPFESKIDIYYETSTAGLVQDLVEDLSNASGAGPTNALFHTTSGGTTNVTGYNENVSTPHTLGFVKATDNDGGNNNLQFYFPQDGVTDGNGNIVTPRFQLNSTTGEVKVIGASAHRGDNRDNLLFKFTVTDPDSSSNQFSFSGITCNNSVPTFTNSSQTKSVSTTAGSGLEVYRDSNITNGATLTQAAKDGLTVSHAFGNTNFNGFFTVTIQNGELVVKTSSSWTATNANTFFGNSQANRTMTITLNDGHASNNTATMTILINELANTIPVTLFRNVSGLGVCNANTQFNGYVSQHDSSNPPTFDGTFYTLHVGNRIFSDQNLTQPVSFSAAYYYNSNSSGFNDDWNELAIDSDGTGIGTDQGEISSIDQVAECQDNDD